MRTRRALVATIAVTTSAALSQLSTGATSAAAGTPLSFGRPTISGIQGVGFEQDLRLDTSGRTYTSVPGSLSSTISWIWRSLDGGKTFKWIPAAEAHSGKLTGGVASCAGGGDTELATDSHDHLYFNDLTLANFSVARSDNAGRTLAASNCISTANTLVDRQWYATDGDPTSGGSLYLAYDQVGQDPTVCQDLAGDTMVANNELVLARSPANPALGATAGIVFAPPEHITGPCKEGIMGNVEVSPRTHHIFVVHDDADLDGIFMARCQPVPFTQQPSGLTCVDLKVQHFEGFKTGGNFPTMTVDSAGNLYAVWERAPLDATRTKVVGDTVLYYSSSTDEGDHWTTPIQIPTPGLHNNVFAWPGAGSPGRLDIAWYGTPARQNRADTSCPNGGPDSVDGLWSLYVTQTVNGTATVPTFSPPVVAGEHFTHRGSIQTLIGGQCGDRTLGDFLQLRIGRQGEANVSYADSNNRDEAFAPHGMFVRQSGGRSVFATSPTVPASGTPTGSVTDIRQDARYEASGMVSDSSPNLDLLSSSVTKPDADHYRITMKVADLTSLAPNPTTGNPDTTLIWHTQWLVPCAGDPNGGRNFHVYMESVAGGTPTFHAGENAAALLGGGVTLTYPGTKTISGQVHGSAPGTITIDVPISAVTASPCAASSRLYSVTSSTMTLAGTAETPPDLNGIGGNLFSLIDVAPPYDAQP